jgi:hypothetical protein
VNSRDLPCCGHDANPVAIELRAARRALWQARRQADAAGEVGAGSQTATAVLSVSRAQLSGEIGGQSVFPLATLGLDLLVN